MTLAAHLAGWLGKWPGDGPELTVVGSSRRTEPGWDGELHPVIGVAEASGRGVLSVPPSVVAAVAAALAEGDRAQVPAAAGVGGRFFTGVFRWSTAPADLPDAGEWVAADDPSVPEWLRPFGGDVLVAVDADTGEHLSGVGIKRHDPYGHELAVVTQQAAQGRGLGRRLVSQAARRVLDEGAVPTYLHAVDNVASAHLAAAAGFPDLGWAVYGAGGS
ncbi:MAG TPA: GNAT family N-acetyltransferase [Pseudonocardia sp.]